MEAEWWAIRPRLGAFYRDGAAVYVGEATLLRDRIWKCHLRTGRPMSNFGLRRNVAESLRIASAYDIKRGICEPTLRDAERVTDLINEGKWAWTVCKSVVAAEALERTLRLDGLPPLTKR